MDLVWCPRCKRMEAEAMAIANERFFQFAWDPCPLCRRKADDETDDDSRINNQMVPTAMAVEYGLLRMSIGYMFLTDVHLLRKRHSYGD